MNIFQLDILTPERPFYQGECVSLVVPISDGMLGIMANHLPITVAIRDGEIRFTLPDGTKRVCAVTRGMLDISRNDVRILCESALAPEEIDEAAERRAMQEAQLAMQEKIGRKDYMLSQMAFARAFNNLRVKRKSAIENNGL